MRLRAGYRWSAGELLLWMLLTTPSGRCRDRANLYSLTTKHPLHYPGTNGRRLREALLDNVDPAAPAEPADSAWRPLATPAVDEAPPSSSDSGTAAAESRAESAWRAASQNGASTSGRPAEAAAASNGAGKQRRSADDSGWGSGLGRVPDDWGSAPPGDAKGAGHHGSTWAGLAGAGVGGSSQNGSHPEGSSGEEAWPDAGGDVSPELETEEAPDIVKLRPQEVVRGFLPQSF